MPDTNKPSPGSEPSPSGKPRAKPSADQKTHADAATIQRKAGEQASLHKPPSAKNIYGATHADVSDSKSTEPGPGVQRPAREVYQSVHLIGAGGMGSVHLARDIQLGRWVALKRMSKEFVSNPRLLERFRIEGRAVAALNHFHIVNIFAMAEDTEGPYIAMEYVSGPPGDRISGWPSGDDIPCPPLNLDDFIRRNGPIPVDRAIAVLRKLCSAVGFAHQKKVIHRDIKPANILLDEHHEPKLTDFGLARQMTQDRQDKTIMGASVGSRGYMAPEQEINAAAVDHRTDLYALGGTLWFMLTGQSPDKFRESEVPAALRPVLVKAMEKDREKRFKSAAEFEQALGRPASGPALYVAPAGAVIPGRCVKCQHVHYIDPKKGWRPSCEMCGANLFDPCLECGESNGVWARFCTCGAELAASLQAIQAQLQAAPGVIATLRKESRYQDAIARLKKWTDLKHSALKEFVQWAKAECQATEVAFAEALEASRSLTSQADKLFTAFDDAAAAHILAGIPEPLRSPEAQTLLQQINDRVAEVAELGKQIKQILSNKQHKGLLDLANRYLQLRPSHADMPKIREWAEHQEAEQEAHWQAAVKQDTVAGYQNYLSTYPGSSHEEAARQLAGEAKRKKIAVLARTRKIIVLGAGAVLLVAVSSFFLRPLSPEERRQNGINLHRDIMKIYTDGSLSSDIKRKRISALNVNGCGPNQIRYLSDLVVFANSALQPGATFQTELAFHHAYQRPPGDLSTMTITVYRVTIHSIGIRLSPSHYNKLKGFFNADPRIAVELIQEHGQRYSPRQILYDRLGPINAREFQIMGPQFYCTTNGQSIEVSISDADNVGTIDPRSVYWPATTFRTSGSASHMFLFQNNNDYGNGTQINVSWTTE